MINRAIVALTVVLASCASTTTRVTPTQTPPPPDKRSPVRVAVIGDFGTGSDEQYALARRMCRWREKHPFRVVLTTGDNIYPGGEPENFEPNFFDPYDCLLDAGVQFRATLGNHDIVTDNGRPELEEPAFGLKERNYILRKKRLHFTVRFVMWESNYSDLEWLREHLGRDDWTVVAFHHPVFSPGPHGSTPGYRPTLPRLFARRGVDLVLQGHDHLYARIEPRRRVRYMVTGGGGAGLYGCENDEHTESCIERHHFLYVVVRGRRIDIKAVPIEGPPFGFFSTEGRP